MLVFLIRFSMHKIALIPFHRILQLVSDSGLQFQGWEDNHLYFPEGIIRPGTSLWQRLKRIPAHEQWAVVENLTLSLGRHSFIACRPERGYREINFSEAGWLDYIPTNALGVTVIERHDFWPDAPPLPPWQIRIFNGPE